MKKFFIFFLLVFTFLVVTPVSADIVTTTLDTGTYIDSGDATVNFYGEDFLDVWGDGAADPRRSLVQFTTPADLGTINSVSLYLYSTFCDAEPLIFAPYLTTETWVANQATWNVYSTGNNWSTPGGDFGSVGGINADDTCTVDTWQEVQFSDSINWGTTYQYLLKRVTESGATRARFESSFNAGGHDPYLSIDYSSATSTPTTTPINTSTDQETLVYLANSQMQMYVYFFAVGLFLAVFAIILFVLI